MLQHQCDRLRPSCSRCVRLNLRCTGYHRIDGFVCENQVAKRNSQRARGEFQNTFPKERGLIVNGEDFDTDLEWLSHHAKLDLPEPLKRDKETRAVDRFFVNWILHPGRDGISPGHLVHLPVLYYQSNSDCILWNAVRAMAFADIKNDRSTEGVPFHIKARNSYGVALSQIREAVQSEHKLSDDRTLAALLLIDSFEVSIVLYIPLTKFGANCVKSMYLARIEPLGPHIAAIKYILQLRGSEQLYDRSRFALFRAANCRLQSRQIQRGEDPEPVQEELLRKLDAQRPEIHVALDIMDMSRLCAEARNFSDEPIDNVEKTQAEVANQVSQLLQRIEELLNSTAAWTSTTTAIWKPKVVDSSSITKSLEASNLHDHPLAHFECPALFTYTHVWFAYIWNFHAASQIVLRECFVRLIIYLAQLRNDDINPDRISREQGAIEKLSSTIIRSFPPLMGFTDQDGKRNAAAPQGLMAGRFLALFAMDVVAKSEYTPSEHQRIAVKVEEWINASHGLD